MAYLLRAENTEVLPKSGINDKITSSVAYLKFKDTWTRRMTYDRIYAFYTYIVHILLPISQGGKMSLKYKAEVNQPLKQACNPSTGEEQRQEDC